jgi:UDP-N-acetylmuramate dehydrogenase
MSVSDARRRLAESLAGEVRLSETMAKHTTYRIGGPAAIFCVLETLHDLMAAMTILEEEEVAWTLLGKGSDFLVSDDGYDGAVLVLGREFKRHAVEDDLLRAGAASILAHLVQDAFSGGLSGLEWAVGIPGTLGGALAMNAGTRDGWIGQVVDTVTLYVPGQGLALVHGRDVVWDYRRSGLAGRGIILEASLRVVQGEPTRIRAQMERSLKDRKMTQPIGLPSAGSVFVNPPGDSAGRLIEAAGLKGLRRGGARVSPMHANFIVNDGGATARDVIGLIGTIKDAVKEKYGIELQPEIKFLGHFEEA